MDFPLFDFASGKFPSESKIARAKATAVGGKRKRCVKGKNCSAACIAAHMVCLVDLPWVGQDLTKVVQAIKSKKGAVEGSAVGGAPAPVAPAPTTPTPKAAPPPVNAPPHVAKAYGFDKNFDSSQAVKIGDPSFNGWADSYDPSTKKLGQGAFGTVVQNPNGTVIKRGDISEKEAEVLKRAGELGVGPKLIAAEMGGLSGRTSGSPLALHDGRIAMTRVYGNTAESMLGTTTNGRTSVDSFWDARGRMHRAGIAHGDLHSDNVLIDRNGRGTIVDFGMAEHSPKAALSEALGAFRAPSAGTPIKGVGKGKGDWQLRQWAGTGGLRLSDVEAYGLNSKFGQKLQKESPYLYHIYSNNLPAVRAELKKMGFNDDEIATISVTGIRNKSDAYTKGPWSRLSDADATKLINILYQEP